MLCDLACDGPPGRHLTHGVARGRLRCGGGVRGHRTAAAAARARPKPSKLVTNHPLRRAVEDGLSQRWSPEEISHRLVKDYPDDESMRVSHETIYQALYFQARGGLKRELTQALRSGRTIRKPHRRPDQRTQRFVDPMIMIILRPRQPLAARHQRKDQRPAAPILPQRHRPQRLQPRRPRTRRPATQRPPTQNARLGNPSRALA